MDRGDQSVLYSYGLYSYGPTVVVGVPGAYVVLELSEVGDGRKFGNGLRFGRDVHVAGLTTLHVATSQSCFRDID